MPEFQAIIQKFDRKGEKTNWCYIEIPTEVIRMLNHWTRKSFRVKGRLDNHKIREVALLPMGDGTFIMPVNASMRRATGKKEGDVLQVNIDKDHRFIAMDTDFIMCMEEDKAAKSFFVFLPQHHQNYFCKWITQAKTPQTKARRIAQALEALAHKQNFAEMLKSNRGRNNG